MTYLSRYCTECGDDRLFEQFHAAPADCPDEADGSCQEWGCTVCGDAVVIGLPRRDEARSDASRAALPSQHRSPLFLGRS
jgi:hypothetical protein